MFFIRHDRRGKAFYQNLGITLVEDPYQMVHSSGQGLIFSHRPITPLKPGVLNLHGHIHNNPSPDVGHCHINLSVEVREFRPWRLGDILRPYLVAHNQDISSSAFSKSSSLGRE